MAIRGKDDYGRIAHTWSTFANVAYVVELAWLRTEEDSLTDELNSLDSGTDSTAPSLEVLESALDSHLRQLLHKRSSTVAESPHRSIHSGSEGRIIAAPARPGSSKLKRKKVGTIRKEGAECSEG